MKNVKKIVLWLIIVTHPFWIASTCGSGDSGPTPTPEPVETVQLDVPYHSQTYEYTCGAVCAWMYIEYLGNRIGFYHELPEDPETELYNFFEENGYNYWTINGEYSEGLNDRLYYYTWTPELEYTKMYYGLEDSFNIMLDMQTLCIDYGEPCIVGFKVEEGYYHGVVLVGYKRDKETGEIVALIAHDPGDREGKEYTIDEWYTYTISDYRTLLWLFVAISDSTRPASYLFFRRPEK